jgi:hypothetical protein
MGADAPVPPLQEFAPMASLSTNDKLRVASIWFARGKEGEGDVGPIAPPTIADQPPSSLL